MAPKQKGVHVSLRNVTPTIPGNEFEHGMLKSDLNDLGCAGLLERPWNLKNEDFIQQFVLIRDQHDHPGSIGRVDSRRLEGSLRLWTGRERLSKPDRPLHRG